METIIATLISAGSAILVCLINNNAQNKKILAEMEKNNALHNLQLEELTREVREHNNFAKRMPVVENEIKHIEDDIGVLKKYHSQ